MDGSEEPTDQVLLTAGDALTGAKRADETESVTSRSSDDYQQIELQKTLNGQVAKINRSLMMPFKEIGDLVRALKPADDGRLIEMYLIDSLVKSFMIIFTNESSQHLLLNMDLIEIAFNCMENCLDITFEAQRQVTRLTSLIIKFPEAQVKLLENN